MKRKILSLLVCLGATVFGTSTVYGDAFEGLAMMRMGAWEVDFSGNVNAFVMNGDCQTKRGGSVAGGFACGGDDDYNDVRDGLLPSWLNFSAATMTDGGWRTAVHISFQPGTHTNSGLTTGLDGALGLSSVNFRQTFLTLSRDNFGTLKIGRDLGVYGSDAILNDMTLLGVGSGASNPDGHTTLGRIGFGYLYADWKAQLQYTTPDFNGLSFTGALVQPWGAGSLANVADTPPSFDSLGNVVRRGSLGNTYSLNNVARGEQEKDTFGFEGKVNYNTAMENGSLGLWASFIYQEVDIKATAGGNDSVSSEVEGFDIGTKVAFGDFDFVGYYYDGEGIGTTSFLLDGLDADGNQRDSDGYYLQARYRIPTGTLLGVSIGESNLDETAWDRAQANRSLVETNESWIIGAYHPVGEALNLVIEYTESESEAHNGNETEEESLAIGAIMFF
jgi:predicted porin